MLQSDLIWAIESLQKWSNQQNTVFKPFKPAVFYEVLNSKAPPLNLHSHLVECGSYFQRVITQIA